MREIQTCTPSDITSYQKTELNMIAARGFGHEDTAAMLEDTTAHLNYADAVQITYEDDRPAAFALYKRRFWQPSH